jgi:hypothetical protein
MRRAAFIVTLVSVAIWALLAILALLGGEFGETQWKTLGSSMLVTAAVAVAMACAVPLHAGRLGPVPWVGMGASVAGFGLLILGIWADNSWDGAFKTALSLVIAAVVIGAVGLIDGARVHAGHRWVVIASQLLIAFTGALVITAVWGDIGSSLFWRGTGIVGVLTAASAVSVPVLHHMASIPPGTLPDALRVADCPFCGENVDGPLASQLTCGACGRRFRVLV